MAYEPKLLSGTATVTTAGTQVVLATAGTMVKQVTVQAEAGNTGVIYLGDSAVASTNGIVLESTATSGDSFTFKPPTDKGGVDPSFDLGDIWVDSAEDGDKVHFLAWVDGYNSHSS